MQATTVRWLRSLGYVLRRPRHAMAARRVAAEQARRLGKHPLFAACTRSELRTLVRWGEEVELPAGVTLLRQHGIARCVIAVLDGALTRTVRSRSTPERIGPADWMGAMEVLAFAPEPATVTTETHCRLFVLGARPVLTFAVHMPGLRSAVFPSLDERAAAARVRELRAEGLAHWRRLRVASPMPITSMTPPGWLRIYRNAGGDADSPFAQVFAPPKDAAVSDALPKPPEIHLGRAAAIIVAAMALGGGVIGATVELPYHAVRGDVISASDAVRMDGGDDAGDGTILLPIVDVVRVTVFGAVAAWHDDDSAVLGTDEVLGGRSAADVDRANRRLMAGSKRSAVAAVSTLLPELVIDPATITIELGDVGGPSGGLAFALALVDKRTSGDLTGGRTIAVTGEIDDAGAVHGVGGVRMKTAAARRAGCSMLILPHANLEDARPEAGSMRLVAVGSLAEAVQTLVAAGGSIESAA